MIRTTYYRVRIIAAPADPNGVNADVSFTTYEEDFAKASLANKWAISRSEILSGEGRAIFACTVTYDPRGYALRPRSFGTAL